MRAAKRYDTSVMWMRARGKRCITYGSDPTWSRCACVMMMCSGSASIALNNGSASRPYFLGCSPESSIRLQRPRPSESE